MKRLPIGIQDFRYMMENDYLYIDKTPYLHMLKDRGKFYFMSRPRRFGKSLTISTYDCMFRGEKELFKDTWLYENWDFEPQPVIRLNMSELDTRDDKSVEEGIKRKLKKIYLENNFQIRTDNMKYMFEDLLEELGQNKRVIVLIDEYDKPILDHLDDHEMAKKIRTVLRTYYSTLQSSDAYLDFVFITGITKFTGCLLEQTPRNSSPKFQKVGVFSTLNNLQDISTHERYSQMLGYTREEIERDFNEWIELGKKTVKTSREDFLKIIKEQYNGFSFDGIHFVYNPFSILNYLDSFKLDNYWVESGSPSFIVKYAKRHDLKPDQYLGNYVQNSIISTYEIEEAPPMSFLIQAGYLTFKDYKQDAGYLIDYPNKEVRDTFSELLMITEYNNDSQEANTIRENILKSLKQKDFELLFRQMQRTFSNIPYTLFEPRKKDAMEETEKEYIQRLEGFYHSVIITMLWAAGVNVRAEELTALGRSDLIMEYEQDVYIIELKKQPPEVSLKQIKDKKYGLKYTDRKLTLVGIEIDDKIRNVSDYTIEE